MKLKDAAIVWGPANRPEDALCGQVKIVLHHGQWERTSGDRWMPASNCFPPGQEELGMFVLFNALVVRDGIDPQVAHKAFLQIAEYRQRIAPDALAD